MFIFLHDEDRAEMFCILPTDRWELLRTHNIQGHATIDLIINDTVYPVLSSDELVTECPEVPSIMIYDLYDEIVLEAINCIKRDASYIDLSDIYNTLLPHHREIWRLEGYVTA